MKLEERIRQAADKFYYERHGGLTTENPFTEGAIWMLSEVRSLIEALEDIQLDGGCVTHATHDPCSARIAKKALSKFKGE